MNIFAGNLNFKTTEDDLRQLFSEFGSISTIKIIKDFDGRSRGFGFIEMDDSEAIEAIKRLNGNNFMGQDIEVNEARPKPTGGGGGRGGYSGNRGSGGGRDGGGGRDFKKRY